MMHLIYQSYHLEMISHLHEKLFLNFALLKGDVESCCYYYFAHFYSRHDSPNHYNPYTYNELLLGLLQDDNDPHY